MTQALNLANHANNINSSGQLDLTTGVVNALPVGNGGTGSNTAAGARTGLGATTAGSNLFTVPNPSAVTYPQVNADNSVSMLNGASLRSAIGAGTGNGTVTSVATGNGLSGGTITGAGTLAIASPATGSIGSYFFGATPFGTDRSIAFGATVAGSTLRYNNGNAATYAQVYSTDNNASLAGTWQALGGGYKSSGCGSNYGSPLLWVRIS